MNHIGVFIVLVSVGLFFAGCATDTTAPSQQFSGYLGDYSKLESVKGEGGEEIRRWINPKIKPGQYIKLMVDPVIFHPAPQVTDQVSMETINQVRQYTNEALRRELAKSYLLVNEVGPDVARVRLALTGVVTEAEGLKPYEYIPIAAIVAGAEAATGTRDRQAYILVEAEVTDSQTLERLGLAVRKFPGKKALKDDTEQLTLDIMRPIIDDKARNARMIFDRVLK